jgi:hypothetical protein
MGLLEPNKQSVQRCELRPGETLLCGHAVPPHRLGVVLRDALAGDVGDVSRSEDSKGKRSTRPGRECAQRSCPIDPCRTLDVECRRSARKRTFMCGSAKVVFVPLNDAPPWLNADRFRGPITLISELKEITYGTPPCCHLRCGHRWLFGPHE